MQTNVAFESTNKDQDKVTNRKKDEAECGWPACLLPLRLYLSGAVFLHVGIEEVFGCERPFSPRNALRLENQ